jgi:hypothetical protein
MYRSDGSLTIGACDNLTKTIYINWSLSDPKFKKVLCHEVTHAAMFSYNVILTIEQEELLADLFATYGEEVIDITNNIFSRMQRIRVREVS